MNRYLCVVAMRCFDGTLVPVDGPFEAHARHPRQAALAVARRVMDGSAVVYEGVVVEVHNPTVDLAFGYSMMLPIGEKTLVGTYLVTREMHPHYHATDLSP